jgi:hypothetical protein
MFRANKKSVCHTALSPPFSAPLRDRELKFWTSIEIVHAIFGILMASGKKCFFEFFKKAYAQN